jgi:cytochrome c oxidase subunit 3
LADLRRGLLAAGVFSLAFLAGQLLVWQELVGLGYFAKSSPANAFFYLLTAAHGLHVLGGLVALGRTTAKAFRCTDASKMRLSVRLCAVYWHFLFVVWLVLFGLLLFT